MRYTGRTMHMWWVWIVIMGSAALVGTPARAHAQSTSTSDAAASAESAAHFRVTKTGTGPAVIMIPGLMSPGEIWSETAAFLSRDHEVHVLHLAGFAGVPASGADPYLATMRDAVIEYIRDAGLQRPVLIGHSLGAFLSFAIASAQPELTGPVIAVDGVPYLGALADSTATAAQSAAQATMVREMFAGMTADALGAQTRMAMTAQARDTAWHAAGQRWGATSDPATVGRAVAEMMTTDLRRDVARITQPVLLVMAAGALPEPVRAPMLASYRAQVAAAPNARVVVAENARHFVMLDDPEFLVDAIATFLGDR